MTTSEDTRRAEHNAELSSRLAATKFVPCHIGRGAAIHAAVSTTKNINGFAFPRPLCQPHSSQFFATLQPEGTEVTCKRCLASLASHPFTKDIVAADKPLAEARELAADVEILEQYDRARGFAGHDYGSGQRNAELVNRRRELDSFLRRNRIEEIEVTGLKTDELVAAFRRVSAPKVARITAESYRSHTPASQRTLQVWNRLFDYWQTKQRESREPGGDHADSTEGSGATSPSTDREARKAAADAREAATPVPNTELADRGTLLLVTTAHPSLFEHTLDGELHPNLGRLIQPRHTSSIERTAAAGIPWAADNDCFQGLDEAAYIRLLDRIEGLPGCLFVTVPDVVGDADETLRLFDHWIGELEGRGLPAALVAQDGLEDRVDDIRWEQIDALFIGGSTEWKEGPHAAELARLAVSKGKWVHWGRVNTKRRFDLIVATGAASSFDGSKFARFRKTYLDQGLTWGYSTRPSIYTWPTNDEIRAEGIDPDTGVAYELDEAYAINEAAGTWDDVDVVLDTEGSQS